MVHFEPVCESSDRLPPSSCWFGACTNTTSEGQIGGGLMAPSSRLTCVCAPGFENDRIMWMVGTCTAPVGLFEATYGVSIAAGLVCLFMTWIRLRAAHREVGVQLAIFGMSSFALTAASAIALGQGYASVSFWVVHLFYIMFLIFGVRRMLLMFFTFSYSLCKSNMKRQQVVHWLINLYSLMAVLPDGVVLPIYLLTLGSEQSPNYDTVSYNMSLILVFFIAPAHLFIATPLCVYVGRDLLLLFDESIRITGAETSTSRNPLKEARKRVVEFLWTNAVVLPISTVCLMIVGLALPSYYGWPYVPWFSAFALATGNLALIGQVRVVASSPAMTSTSSRVSSKNAHNNIVTVTNKDMEPTSSSQR